MPLDLVASTHVRATCEACGAEARLCPKRLCGGAALEWGAHAFRGAGWHLDVKEARRDRVYFANEKKGAGKWYCPACASRSHL